jgi:hypothetical protein
VNSEDELQKETTVLSQALNEIASFLSLTTDDKRSLHGRVGAARLLTTLVDQFLTSRMSSLGKNINIHTAIEKCVCIDVSIHNLTDICTYK